MGQQFEIGDVVFLNSGGPGMTVVAAGDEPGGPVRLLYFDEADSPTVLVVPAAAVTADDDDDDDDGDFDLGDPVAAAPPSGPAAEAVHAEPAGYFRDHPAVRTDRPAVVGMSAVRGQRFWGPYAWIRQAVADELVNRGADRDEAEAHVLALGDGRILKWLLKYGPDIAKFVLLLLPLFAEPAPAPAG